MAAVCRKTTVRDDTPTSPSDVAGTSPMKEERIDFLYSAFPSDKNVNPKHWESKTAYWINAIEESAKEFGDICVTCQRLRERFKRNECYPSGLDVVVDEMVRLNKLVPVETYTNYLSTSWREWGFGVVQNSLSWLVKRGSPSKDARAVFVVAERVQVESEKLLKIQRQSVDYARTDCVVPWNVAMCRYSSSDGSNITEESFAILMGHLCSQKQVKIGLLDEAEKVIKFSHQPGGTVNNINDVDLGIVKLKKAIAKIELEAERLGVDSHRLQRAALQHHHHGNDRKAKLLLRERNQRSSMIAKRDDALHALKDNLRMIQSAESLETVWHDILKRRSTASQLLETLNDWTVAVKSRCGVDVICFDMAKAFDTVPHNKLLTKLQGYRFMGHLFIWISVTIAMATSSALLKATYNNDTLSVKEIEDVTLDLEESRVMAQEVERALAEAGQSGWGDDESNMDELELELASLLLDSDTEAAADASLGHSQPALPFVDAPNDQQEQSKPELKVKTLLTS